MYSSTTFLRNGDAAGSATGDATLSPSRKRTMPSSVASAGESGASCTRSSPSWRKSTSALARASPPPCVMQRTWPPCSSYTTVFSGRTPPSLPNVSTRVPRRRAQRVMPKRRAMISNICSGWATTREGRSSTAMRLTRDRDPRARRVHARPDCLPPDMTADGHRQPPGADFRAAPGRARERTAEVLRHVGLYEERYRRDRRVFDGDEAAGEARPGARPRPAAAAPRRADERTRPGRPRRDARS